MKTSTLKVAILAVGGLALLSAGVALLSPDAEPRLEVAQADAIPAAPAPAAPGATPTPEELKFSQTADRVTLGSGQRPQQGAAPFGPVEQMLQQMAALSDGDAKEQMAQQISAITERGAASTLLDWSTTTNDRALLRASLEALGRFGDEALLMEINARYAASRSYDERYRLAKVVRSLRNPEAAPALMTFVDFPGSPTQLVTAAWDAFANIGTGPAVSMLLQRLDTGRVDEEARLATAIGRIENPAGLPALQYAAAGNKDTVHLRTRVAAIQALANFDDQDTREVLTSLTQDPAAGIRSAALAALDRKR